MAVRNSWGSNLRWNSLIFNARKTTNSQIKIQQIFPFYTSRRRVQTIIVKYAQSSVHQRGLLSRGKDLTRLFAQGRESHRSHQITLAFLFRQRKEELCQGYMKITVQRQIYLQTKIWLYNNRMLILPKSCFHKRIPALTVNYTAKGMQGTGSSTKGQNREGRQNNTPRAISPACYPALQILKLSDPTIE